MTPTRDDNAFLSLLLKEKMINEDGIVQSWLCNSKFNSNLELDEIKELEHLVNKTEKMVSRSSLEICTISALKVMEVTDKVARTMTGSPPKFYLRGSCVYQLLSKTILRIFNSLIGGKLTFTVNEIFTKKPKDTDYLILLRDCYTSNACHQILKKGLITHLTEELKKKQIRPAELSVQLERAHQKALEFPPGTYPHETAKLTQIQKNDPDLTRKFIEMCAFQRANYKSNSSGSYHHIERVIGYEKKLKPDDFTFSNETPAPSRALDALYVDLSPFNADIKKLKLESFKGRVGIIQAIFDTVLKNMTFDPHVAATPKDFVRMLSFFSTGGRCFQKGWIDLSFQALKKEAGRQNIPWSRFMAKQLISQAKYHHNNKNTALICLTFNAAAIMQGKKLAGPHEISHLWNEIFGAVDKTMEANLKETPNYLIESIKMSLRGGDCQFLDVYTRLQISIGILQHCSSPSTDYVCDQTLTDHQIYLRVLLKVAEDTFYLFLPYDLPHAMNHVKNRYLGAYSNVAATRFSMIDHIATTITGHKKLHFILGGSPSAPFTSDPRLQRDACVKEINVLFQLKEENTWWIAYTLSASLLSQQEETELLKNTLYSLFIMLTETWPSESFKNRSIELMDEMLTRSHIPFDKELYYELMKCSKENHLKLTQLPPKLIVDISGHCLQLNYPAMIDIALELLSLLSEKCEDELILNTYLTIIDKCLSPNSRTAPAQSLFCLIVHIEKNPFIALKHKFLLYTMLYQSNKTKEIKVVERILFKLYVSTMTCLVELPQFEGQLAELFMQIFNFRDEDAELTDLTNFFNVAGKFEVFANQSFLNMAWVILMKFIPRNTDNAYRYLESCITILMKYNQWNRLAAENQAHFIEIFTEKQRLKAIETKDHIISIKAHALQDENYYNQIYSHWSILIKKQLEEWESGQYLQDKIKSFLQLLVMMDLDWSMKPMFISCLQKLSIPNLKQEHLDLVRSLLTRFQILHFGKLDEIAEMWIELAHSISDDHQGYSAIKLRCLILEHLFDLLSQTEQLKNSIYDEFVVQLTKHKTLSAFPMTRILSASTPFLEKLHQRKLWKSIVTLAALSGSVQQTKNTFLKVTDACFQCLNDQETNSLFPLIISILSNIPENIIIQSPLSKLHLEKIAAWYMDKMDYLNVFKWMKIENEKGNASENFLERSFIASYFAIKNKCAFYAFNYLSTLTTPSTYAKHWLKIFRTLLDAKEVSLTLNLIKKNKSFKVSIRTPELKDSWDRLLKQMQANVKQLLSFEDQNSCRMRHDLLAVMMPIMKCLDVGRAVEWRSFIQQVAQGGSLNLVEDVFFYMILDDKIMALIPDINHRRDDFWIPYAVRLSEAGSSMLLQLDRWMHLVYEAKEWTKPESLGIFLKNIAKGMVTAFNGVEINKKRNIAKMTVNFFNHFNISQSTVGTNDGHLYINMAEIALVSSNGANELKACQLLLGVLIMSDPSPLTEEKAIKLVNQLLKNKNDWEKDIEELIQAKLALICTVLKSEYCKDIDYFFYIDYLLQHQDSEEMKRIKQALRRGFYLLSDHPRIFTLPFVQILEKIFNIPSHELPGRAKNSQILSVSLALKQVFTFSHLTYSDFLLWSIEQPAFNIYVRKDCQEMLREFKANYSQYNPMIFRIGKMVNSVDIFYKECLQRSMINQLNMSNRKAPFPLEVNAFLHMSSECLNLTKRVVVIAIIAMGFYAWLANLAGEPKR